MPQGHAGESRHKVLGCRSCRKHGLHAGGYTVPPGQDVMISVYNIHHSPAVWDDPEAFKPERFPLDEPVPNEANTDYRHDSAPTQGCPVCSHSAAALQGCHKSIIFSHSHPPECKCCRAGHEASQRNSNP